MYHICITNPPAWEISKRTGVYGNISTGNNYPPTFWGKLIDLTALKPGDKIFFYVKVESCLYGVFQVSNEPYFCQDNLFNDPEENYPFRFNFNEIMHFPNPIPSSELARLLEKNALYSFITFEKDTQAGYRSIRQITDEEGRHLENVFLKFNPKENSNSISTFLHPEITDTLEADTIVSQAADQDLFAFPKQIVFSHIPVTRAGGRYGAKYEFALQGYIFYSLRRNSNNVIREVGVNNFSECLMEIPLIKSQQHRSDILCLFREGNKQPHFYSIIETKRNATISIHNLAQLLGYMKTFSESKEVSFNALEGIYISSSFDQATVDYLSDRKTVEKENPIRLIKYAADENGYVSFENIEI